MQLWALALYFVLVVGLVGAILSVSYVLGQRHRERNTDSPFESGIVPVGSARVRVSVNYYLVALLFVIFDLEAVFLFGWAIAGKKLGWSGYWGVFVFTIILIAVLIYEWRMGALDWGSHGQKEE